MVTKKKTSRKVKKTSKKKVLVSKKNKLKSIKRKKVKNKNPKIVHRQVYPKGHENLLRRQEPLTRRNSGAKKKIKPQERFPSSAHKEITNQNKKKKSKKINPKDIATLNLKSEHDIAMDFAVKAYKNFDKIIKSIILFGSSIKQTSTAGSDIDIIILIDDVSVHWDQKLIAWYRQELDKLLKANPYEKSLHINTVKLSTWWEDLMRGDPIILNILRQGKSLIDLAGFFEPLKYLLIKGKIKSTPEAIYSCLQRAPAHIQRSKTSELNAVEGLYWAMVDSAHAALIAANISPPSPEHIASALKETFVPGELKMKYVVWYRDLLILHKDITHGRIHDLKGADIDEWQDRTEEFLEIMARIVNKLVS